MTYNVFSGTLNPTQSVCSRATATANTVLSVFFNWCSFLEFVRLGGVSISEPLRSLIFCFDNPTASVKVLNDC